MTYLVRMIAARSLKRLVYRVKPVFLDIVSVMRVAISTSFGVYFFRTLKSLHYVTFQPNTNAFWLASQMYGPVIYMYFTFKVLQLATEKIIF